MTAQALNEILGDDHLVGCSKFVRHTNSQMSSSSAAKRQPSGGMTQMARAA